jgi:hypothetical protein
MLERKIRAELLFYEKHYSAAIRARIRRVRIFEAVWRLFCLHLATLLAGSAQERQKKLTRYKVVYRLYRDWKGEH